jgi:ferredoxin-NADP reductase
MATLKLLTKEHLIDNIWSFRFQPSEPFSWIAGQFIRVEIPHPQPDEEGTKRWFTIASAPYEQVVQITTRVSHSTFKQALDAIPIGGELQLLEMPDGSFAWQDSDLPKVLVAGGIGITPYHSMLKQRVHDGLPITATLVYGSRDEQVAFRDELEQWAAAHPDFVIHYVPGTPVSAASLAELVPNLNQSLVYVSGPDPMVDKLSDELLAAGLPEAQLMRDGFMNYTELNY